MQSLSARKAQRVKHREEAAKQENTSPAIARADETEEEFDAADWLNDSVPNIVAALPELSAEELDAVEAEEKSKKDRVGVMSAIADHRKSLEDKKAAWTG